MNFIQKAFNVARTVQKTYQRKIEVLKPTNRPTESLLMKTTGLMIEKNPD
jgi:hypothetical protein